MSCDGVQALNPICQALNGGATAVADTAFSHIAGFFGNAALSTTTWLWDQIGSATSLDLRSPQLAKELEATTAIAAVLCMGLFLIQVITSILRHEPAGLGRAARGLLVSFLGSVFALASAELLMGAIDELSAGVVSFTMGTNIHGVGNKLAFTQLTQLANPALVLIFAIVILCASVMVWAAMMTRKMMILIAAVLAPLAFSGATADITRSWVRRWVEFVAAMIASKLLLVIILSVGVSVLDGAGQAGSGPTQAFTQLSAGSLILLMGGLSPWVAIRMFHFAGDTLYAAHATAAQGSAGARSVVAAPRKVTSVQSQARLLTSSMSGQTAWGGGPARVSLPQQSSTASASAPATTGASVTSSAPAAAGGVGGSTAAVGAGAGGATGAGSAAASSAAAGGAVAVPAVAVPAVAAGAVVAAPVVAGVGTFKAANTAQAATTGAAVNTLPETPGQPTPTTQPKPPSVPRPPTSKP
jgi:type IV secretion system protein TrbL